MRFSDPSTLCLFLLAAVVVLLLIRTRVRLAGQRQHWAEEERAGSAAQRPGGATSAERPLPDNLAQWEVQMHETARQLSAQLDAKLSLLQSLTVEADRAAQRLEEALARAHPVLPPGSQAESLRPAAAKDREEFSPGKDTGMELDRLASEASPPECTDRSRRREEICELADYGFSPAEIARRIGSPIGEVELILSLRQN